MDEKILIDSGFSKHDSLVYLSLLHIGKSPLVRISKVSKVKRTTVYLSIDNLLRAGLIKQIVIKNKKVYEAESPIKIVKILEKRKQDFEKNIPDLLKIFNKSSEGSKVSSYFGKEEIRHIYLRIQDEAKWAKTIFSVSGFLKVFPWSEIEEYSTNFTKRGVDLKTLLSDEAESKRLIKLGNGLKLSPKYKLLPKDYKESINLSIWGNCVAIVSYENLFGVIIENKEIQKFFENQFDTLWSTN